MGRSELAYLPDVLQVQHCSNWFPHCLCLFVSDKLYSLLEQLLSLFHLISWCGTQGRTQETSLVQRFRCRFIWRYFQWSGTCILCNEILKAHKKKGKKDLWGQIGGKYHIVISADNFLFITGYALYWWQGEWGTERNWKMLKWGEDYYFVYVRCPCMHKRKKEREKKINSLEVLFDTFTACS